MSFAEIKQFIKENCTCDCRENAEDENGSESSDYVAQPRHVDLASCIRYCKKTSTFMIPFHVISLHQFNPLEKYP